MDFYYWLRHSSLNLRIHLQRSFRGHQRLQGTSIEILQQLQNQLWNGQFLQGSTGHFRQLWIRDLGLFHDAYARTGQKERLAASLDFALRCFQTHNRVTTTIWPNGRPYNIFTPPADSLPLIVWTIESLALKNLWTTYRDFLLRQSALYFQTHLDVRALPREDFDPAGMRDAVRRKGAVYTLWMSWRLSKSLEALGEKIPGMLSDEKWKALALEFFWNEKENCFCEDLCRDRVFASDANILPFWLDLWPLKDEKWNQIHQKIFDLKLTIPLPLRYNEVRNPSQERLASRIFAPNYQGTPAWANLGMIYLGLLEMSHSPLLLPHLKAWEERVLHDQNFLELFDEKARAFGTTFYSADEGMNWSVQLLALLQRDR